GYYNGCGNYFGGGGAGGSVRIAAPVIRGGGLIQDFPGLAAHGTCGSSSPWAAPAGRVRLEAFQNENRFSIPYGTLSQGSPLSSFVPATPPPTLQVTKI